MSKTYHKDSLGDRMKRYEKVSRNVLLRRTPVILRIDGKAFHTFCKGFAKPYDSIMMSSMASTTKYLCENIQGCVLGYTQSDEITLVLNDYKELNTEAWFNNNIQKMTSVSASMATLEFNNVFREYYELLCDHIGWSNIDHFGKLQEDRSVYERKINKALFDCRAFNVPVNEVTNCLIWRQQDAERNSIQATALSLFPAKQIHGISCKKLQDKMFTEKEFNWNDMSVPEKRGICCIKDEWGRWMIDENIPIFSQDREYIERLVRYD